MPGTYDAGELTEEELAALEYLESHGGGAAPPATGAGPAMGPPPVRGASASIGDIVMGGDKGPSADIGPISMGKRKPPSPFSVEMGAAEVMPPDPVSVEMGPASMSPDPVSVEMGPAEVMPRKKQKPSGPPPEVGAVSTNGYTPPPAKFTPEEEAMLATLDSGGNAKAPELPKMEVPNIDVAAMAKNVPPPPSNNPPLSPEELSAAEAVTSQSGSPGVSPGGAFPMDEGKYGRQTAGQMASTDAPVYLPPAPPMARDGKDAFSKTGKQNELFGVEAPVRDVEGEMSKLAGISRSGTPEKGTFSEPDFSGHDKRAQIAFIMNWITEGPEQAQAFMENYNKGKADAVAKAKAKFDEQESVKQDSAPISDAQAQMLVRTYRISPEAAAKMTRKEYAELEPVLKSTGYASGQATKGEQNLSIEQMKLIEKRLAGMEKNATGLTKEQISGENQEEVARIRAAAKKDGGGGGGGPRDIRAVMISSYGAQPGAVEAIDSALAKMEAGEQPAPGTQEAEMMAVAQNLRSMGGKDFNAVRKNATLAPLTQRTGKAYSTELSLDAKRRDPPTRTKARVAMQERWSAYQGAAAAAQRLKASGKLDLLAKAPYGRWNAVMSAASSPQDQADFAAISRLINPEMRRQTGAALSAFEKDMSFSQFGISGNANPWNSSQALEDWIKHQGKQIKGSKAAIEAEYPGIFSGKGGK